MPTFQPAGGGRGRRGWLNKLNISGSRTEALEIKGSYCDLWLVNGIMESGHMGTHMNRQTTLKTWPSYWQMQGGTRHAPPLSLFFFNSMQLSTNPNPPIRGWCFTLLIPPPPGESWIWHCFSQLIRWALKKMGAYSLVPPSPRYGFTTVILNQRNSMQLI